MKKCMILAALIVSMFAVTAEAYRIDIAPTDPGQSSYSMAVGEEVVFTARGYVKEGGKDAELPVTKIFWQFDYSYLQKADSDSNNLRLKALKSGTVDLKVTGIVGSFPVTKTIAVTIKK